MYTPLAPPSDPKALPAYLQTEFARIAAELANPLDRVRLRELPVVPTKFADGWLIYADGANYDPGSGEGPYCRINGAWVPLSSALSGVSKSADYGFALTDANRAFLHPSADTTARTWTIPANASVPFPVYTALTFINQDSAGTLTIAITSDTMRLAGAGTTGSRTLTANGIATAVKVTSTEWIISGTNLT